MASVVPTNRRWIQWSLRGFLIAIVALAIVFAWYGARLRREARINNAVLLIAASPGWWPSDEYNPIAVVQAVNALHGLGRADALLALRRFAKEYPSNNRPDDRHETLRLVIPLLFDRADPEDRFPYAFQGDEPGKYRLIKKDWPFFSEFISIEGDIPFHRVEAMLFTGTMGDYSYAIDWAQKSGRVRANPLRPEDSPFDAADRLVDDLGLADEKLTNDFRLKRRIREQVLSAVADLRSVSDREICRYKNNRDGGQMNENYRDLAEGTNWIALRETCERMLLHIVNKLPRGSRPCQFDNHELASKQYP